MNENPYSPPSAKLSKEVLISRSIFWKIYFVILIVLSTTGIATYVNNDNFGMVEIIDTFLFILATIGFFGFVFSKKILNYKIWQVFLALYLPWCVLYYFIGSIEPSTDLSESEILITEAISLLFAAPFFLGLFFYARPTSLLWQMSLTTKPNIDVGKKSGAS